jgi:hypothetical protein
LALHLLATKTTKIDSNLPVDTEQCGRILLSLSHSPNQTTAECQRGRESNDSGSAESAITSGILLTHHDVSAEHFASIFMIGE